MSLVFLALHSMSVTAALAREPAQSADDGPLVQTGSIELPAVNAHIDHLAIDLKRERLFVAAVGNNSVEIVDLKAMHYARSLQDLKKPQGILYLADSDRIVVACGGSGTCEVFDGEKLEHVASVEVGSGADSLRYDARTQRVYVAHGEGALGIVDARTWKVDEGSIGLNAHPEGFQLSADGKRAFVNVPGTHQFAVVDLEARKIVTKWAVSEADHNFPMALVPPGMGADTDTLLLIGCRSPAKLVLRWAESGKAAGVANLSGDVDDLFVDEKRRRVYAACGEGSVDVFAIDEKLAVRRLERVITGLGARTCLYVPERNQLFVAIPPRFAQSAEIRVFAAQD